MRKLAFILFLISALSAAAADTAGIQSTDNPLRLKNGSFLFIDDEEHMRMTDQDGKPIKMEDGIEMELEDGTLIMMKNKKIWRHDHRKMKM